MPSSAYQQLHWNLQDVSRLEDAHDALNPEGQGRRALGHITRSGLVMLCAGWELYFEDLVAESVEIITANCNNPAELPIDIRRSILKAANKPKHELSALALCGDGWKQIYKSAVSSEADKLNTPKSEQLGLLAKHYLGIENISTEWEIGADGVNEIVSARGEIAHRGRNAAYIPIWQLRQHKNRLLYTATETDNFVGEYLRDMLDLGTKPWRGKRLPEVEL